VQWERSGDGKWNYSSQFGAGTLDLYQRYQLRCCQLHLDGKEPIIYWFLVSRASIKIHFKGFSGLAIQKNPLAIFQHGLRLAYVILQMPQCFS
jgi:hypothetical protein